MSKKRVLFIMPKLQGGGAEKVLVDILKNYDYSRYRVDLCLIYNEGIYLKEIPKQVNIITLYPEEASFKSRLFRKINLWFHCDLFHKRCIRKSVSDRYEVIISFMEGYSLKFHLYVADRTSNNISWVHIDLLKYHYTQRFFKSMEDERQHYRTMNRVIFVSQDARKSFIKLFGELTHYQVIYNLIDKKQILATPKYLPIEKTKFTICAVGRLSTQKRFDRVIRVAALLKQNHYNVEFWILGIGELETELKKLARNYHVEESVLFKGFIAPPYAHMAAADLLLLTSDFEGAPVVICEAFFLGKPVVATRTTGPEELLDNSKYGILTDYEDHSIYMAVKRLIDDPKLLEYYHNQSLARAEMFDVTLTMTQIYTLYD